MYPPTVRATAMSNPPNRGSTPLSRTESYRWIVLGVAVIAQMLTALVSQGMRGRSSALAVTPDERANGHWRKVRRSRRVEPFVVHLTTDMF